MFLLVAACILGGMVLYYYHKAVKDIVTTLQREWRMLGMHTYRRELECVFSSYQDTLETLFRYRGFVGHTFRTESDEIGFARVRFPVGYDKKDLYFLRLLYKETFILNIAKMEYWQEGIVADKRPRTDSDHLTSLKYDCSVAYIKYLEALDRYHFLKTMGWREYLMVIGTKFVGIELLE